MRLVYVTEGAAYDLEADVVRPDATVGDLASALGASGPAGLYLDGLHQPGDFGLLEAGFHEGVTVSFSPPAEPAAGWDGGLYVSVLTGADAGLVVPVRTDAPFVVGRDPESNLRLADPTVSRAHCRLDVDGSGTVTVTNLSSSVGTRVDGVMIAAPVAVAAGTPILVGSVLVTVEVLGEADRVSGFERALRLGGQGTVGLNRPPRLRAAVAAPVLTAPEAPTNAGKPPFNLASLITPIIGGAVMAVLFQPVFAVFALLSPIMVLGNWWETKHRSARNLRGSTRDFARALDGFRQAVEVAHAEVTATRRAATPSPPEILRRALLPSVSLWERRSGDDDFLRLGLGQVDEAWSPDLGDRRAVPGAEVRAILAGCGALFDLPRQVDLAGGGVVGIVGPRAWALAAARCLLVQAAVLHGPADLRIAVVAADDPDREWDWTKWLPHTRDQAGGGERRLLAAGPAETEALLDALLAEAAPTRNEPGGPAFGAGPADAGPTTLYVVDGDELLSGRNSAARRLLAGFGGPAAGIVVAPSADRLPAVCTEIVAVTDTGEATVQEPRLGRAEQPVRLAGLDGDRARRAAVALARLDDPELRVAGAALPGVVRLGGLLGVGAWSGEVVGERWRRSAATPTRLAAAIGVAEEGVFELDLDRHGPHGLIGGTTGSGKSELLKTLVASLAASYGPDRLTFGLFDFKGGATFADFAALPHTVGMASDLDVNLAKRALRCLRAELVHRERLFETAGVKDLAELDDRQQLGDAQAGLVGRLPRLVVIIDEFAAMAKELADEIGALADLTARGRSLGVHLLLATQKPSTAVNAEIKANTRLRISLQVEDRQDSLDVVGVPGASEINHRGRGYFRVGQGEVLPIQTAWSTDKVRAGERAGVVLSAFAFGPAPTAADPAAEPGTTTTELQTLVDAVAAATRRAGLAPPRRPWPDPLPDELGLDELEAMPERTDRPGDDVTFALADDPDRQTRYPVGWPMRSGNLLFYGVVGSGTTTALATVALAWARGAAPDRRNLYVLDSGAGELVPLGELPHCGSVIKATETERQVRLVRLLTREVERRRSLGPADRADCPTVLVVIDNLEGFRAAFDDVRNGNVWDQFVRLYADGPESGVYVAASVGRVGGVPSALSTITTNKVLFRLADVVDYGAVGLSRSALPTFVPGRAVRTEDGAVVQVAVALPSLAEAVAATAASAPAVGGPQEVASLRDVIPGAELVGRSQVRADRWDLVVAQRDDDLAPGVLSLYDGEHALVAGPARSGKSNALLALAAALRQAAAGAVVYGFGGRRSPLGSSPLVDRCASSAEELGALVDLALVADGPTLLLVDDAELVDDPGGKVAALLAGQQPNLHVVAAAKADVVRSLYGHWTQVLRRSRAGLLLQPALDRDGELLGARLPYRVAVELTVGRGFLVCGGDADLVQTVTAPPAGPPLAAG